MTPWTLRVAKLASLASLKALAPLAPFSQPARLAPCIGRPLRVAAQGAFWLIMLSATLPAQAQELRLHLGALHAAPQSRSESTYAWALEYRTPLSARFSAGLIWLNEGHLQQHHRDGQAVQLWWHAPQTGRLRWEAGLGPYHYYDTASRPNLTGYVNDHGWGLLASIGVTAFHDGGWNSSLRLNRVQVPHAHSSTGLVAGVGYRFGPSPVASASIAPSAGTRPGAGDMEFDVMLGRTIVNSFSSEGELAKGIGVRWRGSRYLALSLGYLHEGHIDGGNAWRGSRSGLVPQLWLEKDLTQRIVVGVGLGPHFALEKPRGTNVSSISTMSSVTAGYRFTPLWIGRMTWNRIATDYSADTDVVVFIVGRRF